MLSTLAVILAVHLGPCARRPLPHVHRTARCEATATATDVDSEAWPALRSLLDQLPCFTCVNSNGDPLGYEREGRALSIFFVDVARAEQELEGATAKWPELGLRLLSVGLGDAYERSCRGDAVVVPSQTALARAGADWDSETLPLFTCLAMSKPAADSGSPTIPFFMDPDDAQANLDAAIGQAAERLTEEQLAQLQLVCTPLPRAVDIIVSGEEKAFCAKWGTSAESFQFVAPSSSVNYLRAAMEELERRQGTRSPSSTPLPTPPRAGARQAGSSQPSGGLFPE